MMFKLYGYQQKLIEETRKCLMNGSKSVLIVSPAGSGKSVVISEFARLTVNKGGQVLFFVHRKELIEQITNSFKKGGVDLKHCTIMTVGKVAHRLDKIPKPTLIICDESHHSLAKTYKKIYEYYSDVPRLGFTASPWRLSGKGLGDVYESMVEGPDVKWLIDNHYLAPYDYYSVKLIDDTALKRSSTGDYTNKSIDDAVGKVIYGDVIKTYKEKVNGQKAIVYAHSIEFSKKIAQEFNEAGISAEHADSKTPAKEREKIMSNFKTGKIKVLCNVDLVSEGYNVPDCSVVIMLRPTESLVLDIQQSMRCMRYKPNKKATIIDHVANYTRFGLPDTPRTWSLEGRDKKKSGGNNSIAIRTCPHCFAVISAAYSICPICGQEIGVENKELKVDKTVKVEKIGKNFHFKTDYEKVRYSQMKTEDATSFRDLQKIGKARGYKPGWSFYQAKVRGFVHQN
ncbi:helicase [Companilactobacillus nuruki]|uniref:Helicase n=2 Tax=Companilactobacillus nuruki TaxID=1993540 RepID=A0A2N7AV41_9LACO|nr:helicase [Companilactobacillus nuruki]